MQRGLVVFVMPFYRPVTGREGSPAGRLEVSGECGFNVTVLRRGCDGVPVLVGEGEGEGGDSASVLHDA
jgi:hypothetical protein